MCGIAGLLGPGSPLLEARVAAMSEALRHRGPDGLGVWCDSAAGIALGHARLAIRDLSSTGGQPMLSASGRFAIAYNGEIYNSDEMKSALAGHAWRGTSDTEILLEHCAAFGLQATLRATNGMFAFALWDRERRELTLARDRFGIKPLYWALVGNEFLFGSELKALMVDPDFPRDLNPAALDAFTRLSYVPEPLSIWQAARKLEPGSLLTLRPGGMPEISRWWDATGEIRASLALRGRNSRADLIEEIDFLLADAVRRQTVSDVPIGVFLSGGIDSSAVASYLAATGDGQDSFTIGFDESGYDESGFAKAIADHLGFRHHERRIGAADALAVVPDLALTYDEPFADSSQIPTLLISRFASSKVKVVLSGDGGDEIFAGYNRHRFTTFDWPRLQTLPMPLRRLLAGLVAAIPPAAIRGLGLPQAGEKLQKLAAVLPLATLDEVYASLTQQGQDPRESPLAMSGPSPYPVSASPVADLDLPPLDRMQIQDIRQYLPGDVLTKVDRASMAVGLEVRVPLLDHRLLAPAFSLAPAARFQDGQGKALLRQALVRRLPPHLFEGRPKRGFAVPIDEWLRGPLKDWAGDLLAQAKDSGLFDKARIDGWWNDHQSGRRKRHHALWNLAMFQAWRMAG